MNAESAGSTGTRCSLAALARGDELTATAPYALGWLLFERRRAWAPTIAENLRAEWGADGDAVGQRAIELGVRVQCIRQPGRPRNGPRRWALADCRAYAVGTTGVSPSVAWGDLDGPDDLMAALEAFAACRPAGRVSAEPVYLVCTHGRKDVCCAIAGRPLAAELAGLRPDQTWECSHTGGDRFAPNLVVLPAGLAYGRVDAPADVVEAYERGEVWPSRLRGFSALPPQAQAAQAYARTRVEIAGHHVDGCVATGLDSWRVEIDGRLFDVHRSFRTTEAALTCSGRPPGRLPRYRVIPAEADPVVSPTPPTDR